MLTQVSLLDEITQQLGLIRVRNSRVDERGDEDPEKGGYANVLPLQRRHIPYNALPPQQMLHVQ